MVRYYQRKSEKVSGETIRDAIKHYETSGNQRETCILYGLTRSVFQKYLKRDLDSIPDQCTQGRFKPVFSVEQEEEIISYINSLANRFYAITRRSLAELAFQLAERNHLQHTFQNGIASDGWINSFLLRHERTLSLQTGTPTSFARITEFARQPVYRFFDLLEEIVAAKGFSAETIFNMDETGLTVVPSKQPKRIAQKGRRSLPVVVAKERGELCTIICSFSANGKYIPPMFVFPKKARNINYTDAPANSIHAFSNRGWSNSECFLKWLKHFRKFASDNPSTYLLLLLDNHGSHICYEAVKYCRAHRIELLTLPPHSTHKLQPLDVGLFSPLKAKYNDCLVKWHFQNQNKMPRLEDIPGIFRRAYEVVNKKETAVNAFRKTGIWQYNTNTEEWKPNRHIFDEEFDCLEGNISDNISSPPSSDSDSGPDSSDGAAVPQHLDTFWIEDPPEERVLPPSLQSSSLTNPNASSNADDVQREIDLPSVSHDSCDRINSWRPWLTETTSRVQRVQTPLMLENEMVEVVNSRPLAVPQANLFQSCESEEICRPAAVVELSTSLFLPSQYTDRFSKRLQIRMRRESLVPYDSSSEDENEIDPTRVPTAILDVQDDTESEILLGFGEQSETNIQVDPSIPSTSKQATSKASTFSVGPFELEGQTVNTDPGEQVVSNRKPRPKLSSERMTSDENMKKLTKKEMTNKRKKTSSDSQSEEKRQTRSSKVASKLSLRNGKRV